MINTVIEQIKLRKNFYRNLYRKELIILIVLLISQVVFVGAIAYLLTHQKVPAFYASSSDGILSPLNAMPTPNQQDKPLLQ